MMRGSLSIRLLFAIAVLAVCAPSVRAQVLRVEVRDTLSNAPVARALVSATDSSGRSVDGLTGDDGALVLRLPRAGAWAVAVRRIGIAPQRHPAVEVTAEATVTLALRVSALRVRLPGVTVRARTDNCGHAPVGDDRTATLWEQITLALRSSLLARGETERGVLLRFTQRERTLNATGAELSARELMQGIGAGRPFIAADPDSLAQFGYIVAAGRDGSRDYYAPDETVLLSESFVRTHCFEAPSRDADPALAELRFRPTPRRRVPDVEGTAFVDTLSGELRRIDFRYVASRELIPSSARLAGGTVALRRLESGRWIVSEWAIRMPLLSIFAGIDSRIGVTGYREMSGVVDVLPQAPRAPAVPRTPPPR